MKLRVNILETNGKFFKCPMIDRQLLRQTNVQHRNDLLKKLVHVVVSQPINSGISYNSQPDVKTPAMQG